MGNMTKTPEQDKGCVASQMAEEYADLCVSDAYYAPLKAGFLAGYQAAKDQLADVNKVVTADYVETASNDAKELITKFELQGDQDMLIKALVAAYCSGVDAVDGYLRNSLSAYRNSVKRLQWISVKERLPPPQTEVLWWNKAAHQAGVSSWEYMSYCDDTMIEWGDAGNVSIKNFTHWMPLPNPPKDK